jgi:hypothetical protein
VADGWQDKQNGQLINFLMYFPRGISFIRSVDASDIVKDATNLCHLFVELVEFASPKNVVHLVMDNAANYKATGRILHDKYPHIYWSLCATQIDGNRSKFLNEANLYRGKVGEFCKQLAIDSIKHMHPSKYN